MYVFYGLVYNGNIEVGPRQWSYSFFKDFLEEEGLDWSTLPRNAPEDGKVITDQWKILPVTDVVQPSYEDPFEQWAGPYWTINEDSITGLYEVVPNTIEMVKGKLKESVTNTRYKIEVGGTKFIFADGTEVSLYTTREDRNVYLQAYQIMADDQSVVFKFTNAVFKTVTKAELGAIVDAVATHIQTVFTWESNKYAEINACTTIDELKNIDIEYLVEE